MTLQEYDELYRGMLVKKMVITTSGGITLLNKDIASEEMSLEESLCSEPNLRYGTCESSCFSLRIVYSDHSFVGEWLDVYQKIYTDADGYLLNEDGTFILNETGGRIQLESEADATVHIGKFKVFSDKPTNDRLYRDLVCYDLMYDILNADVTAWSDNLTFPMTVKNFRDSFFNYIGVTQETTTLVNDDFNIVGEYIVESSLSGKTIIEAICELNGVFGHINRDGKFEYITLPSDETIEYPYYVDGSGAYEDYETEVVTGIIARSVEGDLGTLIGTNDNIYYIDYNPLLFGAEGSAAMEDALENLLDVISEVTYRPFKVTTYGNPMLPLGTNVIFNTRNQTIESFVMNRVLRGIQALKDDFSAVGEQYNPKDINSARNEVKQLNGKAHVLRSDVDQLYSEVYDEQGRSVISQLSNEVVLKVDSNGNLASVQLDASVDPSSPAVNIKASKINIESDTIKFDNEGYKVSGDIYTTHITPNNNQIYANYSEMESWLEQDYHAYDPLKMIQERNMGYFYNEWDNPNEHSYGTHYQNLNAYNTIILSSNLSQSKKWLIDPIERQYGSSYWRDGQYIIIGRHCVIYDSEYDKIINDGGYVDKDHRLVLGTGKKLDDYYMVHDMYVTIGRDEETSDDYFNDVIANPGFCIVPYSEFDPYTGESGYSNFSGQDIIVAIKPSVCFGRDDCFDFSGLCWGKTSVGRESLKGTISALAVQGSSDRRLKRDIEKIDERLIKAICECPTYQFKLYNEDLTTVGIMAQDFIEACKKYGIDPDGYSLCQKHTVKDNDDTEYYYIEYSQYLTLKSIHLQNQIDELKALMGKESEENDSK